MTTLNCNIQSKISKPKLICLSTNSAYKLCINPNLKIRTRQDSLSLISHCLRFHQTRRLLKLIKIMARSKLAMKNLRIYSRFRRKLRILSIVIRGSSSNFLGRCPTLKSMSISKPCLTKLKILSKCIMSIISKILQLLLHLNNLKLTSPGYNLIHNQRRPKSNLLLKEKRLWLKLKIYFHWKSRLSMKLNQSWIW